MTISGKNIVQAENDVFRVELSGGGRGYERLLFRSGGKWVAAGRVHYHVKYWLEPKGEPVTVRLSHWVQKPGRIRLYEEVDDLGVFSIEYQLDSKGGALGIECRFERRAATPIRIGGYFLGFEPPRSAKAVRMLPGCYGGFTLGKSRTLLWQFDYDDRKGLTQMAPGIDQAPAPQGTCWTSYQYMVLTFPPAYQDGVAEVQGSGAIVGRYRIQLRKEHIWDPALAKEQLDGIRRFPVLPPRHSYEKHVANWDRFVRDPDLWVPLGPNMGLFHVGFYGMLTKWQYGGPYGWSLKGRLIRYKQVYDIVFGKLKDKGIQVQGCQKNMRQCEIAWGNGGNSMVAYSLYHHGAAWARRYADQIVEAILALKGRGFQIPRGPLAGAWINAYEALTGRFTDHYAGQQVFLPDQGYVNYFLGLCYLEGHRRDPRIVEAVRRNVEDFLEPMFRKYGRRIPNAFSPDGTPGYSREGYPYDFPNAPGLALAAVSHGILHEMTGEARHMEACDRLWKEHVAPRIKSHEFGFLEYDHRGHDSAGACVMLMAFAHYLEMEGGRQRGLVEALQEKVFYYLMGFRHEHDYFLTQHSHNMDGWHGLPINRYGFMHGYTRGSIQGTYVLHVRWEYAYALLRTAQTATDARVRRLARMAMEQYLNCFTYQQFVNRKLPKGFGGVSEHTALSTYVQDTTHIIHSTPLAMLLLRESERAAQQRSV